MSGIEFAIGSAVFSLADVATAVGLGVTAASTVGQISAQQEAGRAAQESANYQAKQAETLAGQKRASSRRAAMEQTRRGAIVASNARAAAGASGGSLADPTVQDIFSGIDNESDYRKLAMLYEGEDAARGLETQASLGRYAGQQERNAANSSAMWTGIGGFGKVLSDSASFYSKYAGTTDTAGGAFGYGRTGSVDWTSPRRYG